MAVAVVPPIRLRKTVSQRGTDALKRISAALFTTTTAAEASHNDDVPPPPPSLTRSERTLPKYVPDDDEDENDGGGNNTPKKQKAHTVSRQRSARPKSEDVSLSARHKERPSLHGLFSSATSRSSAAATATTAASAPAEDHPSSGRSRHSSVDPAVRWKPRCPEQDITTYPEWIEAERLGKEIAAAAAAAEIIYI